MPDMDRRSALVVGLAAASALAWPKAARAAMYGPNEGKEVAPGVRVVALTDRASQIAPYKTVMMRDVVFQPGASTPADNTMKNDMVCHLIEGELVVSQGGNPFTAKKNDVWSCRKGAIEQGTNKGSAVAIMRVIDLMPT
jgi:quercetin dioxygenase-like cupin family protein